MNNLLLGVTGHRLSRLSGPLTEMLAWQRIQDLADAVLEKYAPDVVYCGMEWTGWDKAIALSARKSKTISLVACIPYEGHENRYRDFLKQFPPERLTVVHVSNGKYSGYKMQKRNEYIASNVDVLVALWDGHPGGGTSNCLVWQRRKYPNLKVHNVWNSWIKYAA